MHKQYSDNNLLFLVPQIEDESLQLAAMHQNWEIRPYETDRVRLIGSSHVTGQMGAGDASPAPIWPVFEYANLSALLG
jgi:hypothetical protein